MLSRYWIACSISSSYMSYKNMIYKLYIMYMNVMTNTHLKIGFDNNGYTVTYSSFMTGLGNTTAKHRWFAIFYIFLMFFCFPAAVFALSVAGWQVALGVLLPLFCMFVAIVIINVMQRKCPLRMTPKMRTWEWLPRPMRTLSFYDRACVCCKFCRDDNELADSNNLRTPPPGYTESVEIEAESGVVNEACDVEAASYTTQM